MVDRNLIREFQIDDAELTATIRGAMDDLDIEMPEDEDWDISQLDDALLDVVGVGAQYDINDIIQGKVIRIDGEEVLVDIGYKSEGVVHTSDWEDGDELPKPGETIEVLLEEIEDAFGLILLSYRKARQFREWQKVIEEHGEGDVVSGTVIRKIKGGLLVDIGVRVFLPASQVDIRRPPDIADYIGQNIECVILKIDEARKNIVVSRRKLIEDKRKMMKEKLLKEIQQGQTRKGIVKNIADFGAFVDLGGIDGLLHITDMSYDRINHPTEMVHIDDELEVMILSVDYDKEKIALGLKQKFPDPWQHVAEKYPPGTRVKGEVVNVMTYGAFVKLEAGVEGLVHISEMSWIRRINHPNDMVHIGDKVDVVVLGINQDKQEISLGMKQTQPNPWDNVAAKYPEGSVVTGTVRNLTNYGAFIELEEGVDGLLHVSDMSWVKKLSHANELLKRGDQVRCKILSVDEVRKRIALGLKQLDNDPWADSIPTKYKPNSIVQGKVTKITNFGVFVELEDNLEGLLHISELADHKVDNPEDEVSVGEVIEVRVLRVDTDDRKIGLSRKLDEVSPDDEAEGDEATAPVTSSGKELRGGTGAGAGPLFTMGGEKKEDDDKK